MKIRRWKKRKDSQQKTSELRLDDGRLAANVSQSKGFGWYWVAGWDCGLMIPYHNSAASGVRGMNEEEAKAAARHYVAEHLAAAQAQAKGD